MTSDNTPRTDPHYEADENFEPYEQHGKMPWPLIAFAVGLGVWGVATLLDSQADVTAETAERAAVSQEARGVSTEPGAALFAARCVTCHQLDGVGVRNAVPPLAGSPFVAEGPELVATILLRGIDGPIRVNDYVFNGHMPSFASALTDVEIGELSSYVSRRFGESDAEIDAAAVATLRAEHADSGSFAGGAGLAAFAGGSFGEQPEFSAGGTASLSPEISALVFDGRGEQWACASCHGDLGQGKENIPRLAGLPAEYIVKQLGDFENGLRINESMRLVVATLSDDERQGLADYYSGLRVPSNSRPDLGGDIARGEQLALRGDWDLNIPACFSCHGPSGFGVAPEFPALAAQHASYTASQLAAWAGGQRNNSPLDLMGKISSGLSERDQRSVADYLSSLPPVPARHDTRSAETGDRP